MRLFSHPVNHFLAAWRNLFRLCAVSRSVPLRETRTCLKGGQVSINFFFFYQFVAAWQRKHLRLSATGADFAERRCSDRQ